MWCGVAVVIVAVVEAEVEAAAPSGPNLAGWPASSPRWCLAAVTQSDPPQQAAGLGAVHPAAEAPPALGVGGASEKRGLSSPRSDLR
jgi:hypothetical protein